MTSREDCIRAIQDAAERLGASPTKAEYEALGLTPSASTILRVVGGWNEAKEAAGLQTYAQGENGGIDVQPKPDWVELPAEKDWKELSGNMRWYYKNRERDIAKKDRRRARRRGWLHDYKAEHCRCKRCGEGNPAALDFHHVNADEKTLGVSKMVANGYAKQKIKDEIDSCQVLCANCHRKEHYEVPEHAELTVENE
ncbi:HNH family endonuclease [Halorhabdus sp. SVX81]|uniref:homing endonuclease associated repeat-containing protein n=1 Tax=Halorhabdus sp. SVX81 TaxID=2978283 RepID=UPI0023DB1FCD|nr:HNH endonuclease [Halorhabdus sp. SVX81]WEL16749.1 HNH family endonuclease [Halorhabdus sp. SVX81]